MAHSGFTAMSQPRIVSVSENPELVLFFSTLTLTVANASSDLRLTGAKTFPSSRRMALDTNPPTLHGRASRVGGIGFRKS